MRVCKIICVEVDLITALFSHAQVQHLKILQDLREVGMVSGPVDRMPKEHRF